MTTVIRCGTLIDGIGADPVQGAVLVIENDTIAAINPGGDIPRDATVIDAAGLTVMPGLIGCHVHLAWEPENVQQTLLTPYSLRIARALVSAGKTLDAGVTTARDAGGIPRGVKQAIDQGLFPGPRLRISVRWLSQTGGHGDMVTPNGVDPSRIPTGPEHPQTIVDGVDAVRRATRELLRAGADQIKVMASGGVLSPSDEVEATGFSPEEIAVIVYEAHAQGNRGIRNAVWAGIESVEHGAYLDEETVAEMKRRGTYLVPTLAPPVRMLRRAEREPGSLPPWARGKMEGVIKAAEASIRMAIQVGVTIAMGTDTGAAGEHGNNAEELELMVQQGMTPMQAIIASTRVAAECCRLGQLTGTLEPGKRADLLAVAGDPLTDIAVLQQKEKLALIMKDGRAYKNVLGATE